MAKNTKTATVTEVEPRQPSRKMLAITKLCAREDGATSEELLKATGETKRRSKWSLTKLAARMGYSYEQYAYEDDPLVHHCFVPTKSAAKPAEKPAEKPVSNVVALRGPAKAVAVRTVAAGKRAAK